jgi:GWxTD domain-containing protein
VTRCALAVLLLAAPVSSALGQAATDRPLFQRLQDSLAVIHDTAALRQLHRSLGNARRSSAPLASLRSALVALRLAETGADPDAGDAIGELRRLTRRHPDMATAWHALAGAEVRRAAWERAQPLALGNRVGIGTLEHAVAHERRALAADSTCVPAAVRLAALTLELRDTALVPATRDALRRAAAGARSPDVLLAWGRIERAGGDPDSAVSAFSRIDGAGPGGALARLELARTLLALGRADGESTYFAGAARDESESVAGYRADLVPIATGEELRAFDRVSGAERTAFLRRFWLDRDAAELRATGERLREHYRRLLYARRHFALTVSRRVYGSRDAYRSGSEELDDRGAIYVRHGEPAERLRPFVFGLMPHETWHYDRADGDLLLHFSAGYDEHGGGDLYDYRLVESVLDLHGASGAPKDQLLLSRQKLSPVYGRMLNWGPYGAAGARARERGIGRASIDFGTTTDSYELQFSRGLTVVADLVAVGTSGGGPAAQFVFAVREDRTAPEPGSGISAYPFRIRVVAMDAAGHAVAGRDTTVELRLGRPPQPGQYLIGRAELPIPPGTWTWRAVVQSGEETGVVLPRDTVRVSPRGRALALSDLALGAREASAAWQPTRADTAFLTPFRLFREGAEVELYYEVTGADSGRAYRHEIAVFRQRGEAGRVERRPVVTLGVDEAATAGEIRSHRTLQLRRLKPGSYVVEVRVAGAEGAVAMRRRAIEVVRRR